MNVTATSIDHNRANISEREIFACSHGQAEKIYETVREDPAVSGAVLINTCNRTELYLSCVEGYGEDSSASAEGRSADPFRTLCDALGVDAEENRHLQKTIQGEDVLRHLCLLTAGAESQLWGDSQIITQVGEAVSDAREAGATDSTLNTIFRLAITAGKEIRTRVDLRIHDASTAARAVDVILDEPEVRSVLVIGNGAVGRMVAELLAKADYDTHMTLRRYQHGQAEIPAGVTPIPYGDRYEMMETCDAVVSATSSPHVVITKEQVERLENCPFLMIDMAVPRDIEASVSEIKGIRCYNIDDISKGQPDQMKKTQLNTLHEYIDEKIAEYRRWEKSREKVESNIERLTHPNRDYSDRNHFPLFINTENRSAVVIGGGNIAERRVMTMAEFGFDITIVSEDLTDTLERMVEGRAAVWIRSRYSRELIEDAWMVLACTNDRDINRTVGEHCRQMNKLVNVCDARNESTFWFPAVALNDELTVGLVGKGTDHMNVKKAAASLRKVVEDKDYK